MPAGSVKITESVPTPRQLSRTFADNVNQGDLNRASACFSRAGCLVTPNDTVVKGRENIAAVIAQMIATGTEIQTERLGAVITGEVALTYERWAFRSEAESGQPFTSATLATIVMRWIEGGWKFDIAAPWGWPSTLQSMLTERQSSG